MSDYARPFNVKLPDGTVLHGVQFPRGFCIVDNPDTNFWHMATGPEHLSEELGPDIVVEWPNRAYLVVQDRGGIFGAYLDSSTAHEAARHTGSVVVALPIEADYRPHTEKGQPGQ
jgi:hypothetical protein